MIDTGAVYPVWMSGEERLQRLGAVKKKDSVPFGGLGGMTRGALYEIPTLQLGDLIYPRMSIIAHRSNFPVPLLLPATMFNLNSRIIKHTWILYIVFSGLNPTII